MNCCIFGSFDPLTIGHEYLITEASKLFDKVFVLVIKNNKFKKRHYNFQDCFKGILDTFSHNKRIEIIEFDGDVYTFLMDNDCDYVVRGVRNVKDYKFEEFVYSHKFRKNFVPYLYIKTPYSKVSSSFIYKLDKQRKINEIKKILPKAVFLSVFKNNR